MILIVDFVGFSRNFIMTSGIQISVSQLVITVFTSSKGTQNIW